MLFIEEEEEAALTRLEVRKLRVLSFCITDEQNREKWKTTES